MKGEEHLVFGFRLYDRLTGSYSAVTEGLLTIRPASLPADPELLIVLEQINNNSLL